VIGVDAVAGLEWLAAKVAGDRCVSYGLGACAVVAAVLTGLAFALSSSRCLGRCPWLVARGASGGGGQLTAIKAWLLYRHWCALLSLWLGLLLLGRGLLFFCL
jgi:hypothetical protein